MSMPKCVVLRDSSPGLAGFQLGYGVSRSWTTGSAFDVSRCHRLMPTTKFYASRGLLDLSYRRDWRVVGGKYIAVHPGPIVEYAVHEALPIDKTKSGSGVQRSGWRSGC